MYLFLYDYKNGSKWCPPDLGGEIFDFKLLDRITTDYQYHFIDFNTKPGVGHCLHHIAKVAIDEDLMRCGILQIDDDFKAMELRLQHDNFLISNSIRLKEVYDNPNFEELLLDCPIIQKYVDRGTTKLRDSKYVTKVANSIAELAYNVKLMNGVLGDDFQEQFTSLAKVCKDRITEYKENNKNDAANLVKERKLIRKRLAVFKAKDL
jgi:hypothetical protein